MTRDQTCAALCALLDMKVTHQPLDRSEPGAEPAKADTRRIEHREIDPFGHSVAKRELRIDSGSVVLCHEGDRVGRSFSRDPVVRNGPARRPRARASRALDGVRARRPRLVARASRSLRSRPRAGRACDQARPRAVGRECLVVRALEHGDGALGRGRPEAGCRTRTTQRGGGADACRPDDGGTRPAKGGTSAAILPTSTPEPRSPHLCASRRKE
jgi:hypothetical protein